MFGASIQYLASQRKSLAGGSAHRAQLSGFGGLQMYPGEQPKTADELESCGNTGPEFVGDGQVTNSVTVTVDPGSVIYAVDPLIVAPRLTVV